MLAEYFKMHQALGQTNNTRKTVMKKMFTNTFINKAY